VTNTDSKPRKRGPNKPKPESPDLMTRQQVAVGLGVCFARVDELRKDKTLTEIKIGRRLVRITRESYESFLRYGSSPKGICPTCHTKVQP